MTLLAFRAHVTTAAGQSLHLGVLASGRTQADSLLDQALPEHRGAQLRFVRYLCAHGSGVRHSVVLRAATEQGAQAWAQILLAGEVQSISPLPDRIRFATPTTLATAALGALSQALLHQGAQP
jgi:hypothetical protein